MEKYNTNGDHIAAMIEVAKFTALGVVLCSPLLAVIFLLS